MTIHSRRNKPIYVQRPREPISTNNNWSYINKKHKNPRHTSKKRIAVVASIFIAIYLLYQRGTNSTNDTRKKQQEKIHNTISFS